MYDNSKFIIVDFIKNQISKKSKSNIGKFPSSLLKMTDKCLDIVLHPSNPNKLMLIGYNYYVCVYLD